MEPVNEPDVKRMNVDFHYGNVIQYLAETYGTGFEVVREAVQNAIDKSAKNIFVLIDCVKRLIVVYDDGFGASEDEMMKKFQKIGLSFKLGQVGMVGQKGIGNLAAFSIGRQWQLFTRDIKKGEKLRAYTFDRAELVKGNDVAVQSEMVRFKSVTGAPFPATSMLRIIDVDQGVLRQLGDYKTIDRTLREAFNAQLRSGKISLRVSYQRDSKNLTEFMIKPTKFRGAPIDPEDYETDHGPVTFEFYHSYEPLKDPSILVLHQGTYSLPLTNFFKLRICPPELEPLFAKGYFEGEIRLGFCKLNSSRSAFEHNAEQQSFVSAVEQFTAEILQPLVEQFEQSDREERLKRIAEGVLRKMKSFLNKHPDLLPPGLKALIIKKAVEGPDPLKNDIITPPEKKRPRQPLPPDAFKRQRRKSKDKTPKPRKPVVELRDGLAIQIINPAADDELMYQHSRLTSRGVIQINGMHNDFTEAYKRGQSVCHRYMFLLVQKELTCASLSTHEGHVFRQAFEKTFLPFYKASLFE